MARTKYLAAATLLLTTAFLLFGAALAQQQSGVFAVTDALSAQADQLQAKILAPKNFAAAQTSYSTARKYVDKGRIDVANKHLLKANASLRNAIDAANIARVTFADSLKARDRAMSADASEFEPALWAAAEDQLLQAARKLEGGALKPARNLGYRAGHAYDQAELAAIKTKIVGTARESIAQAEADPNRVDRNAPITFASARSLLAQAEATLDNSRYQTDGPQELAAEAEYQARHARYLASEVAKLAGREITAEQLLLKWEQPMRDIAAALEVTTDMSAGFAATSEASMARATSLVAQNGEKNARINQLEVVLGDTEMVLEESERVEQQFADVEQLFDSAEAELTLVNNDLVLRLVGLDFPGSQAVIESQYFQLLTDVQRSLHIFNDANVVVAVHTDSQGDEDTNLVLSQERANAVRSYLIANSGLQPTRISAEGYGESRPVATNMYEHGRAQNRRIEIIFKDVRAAGPATALNAPR